jgi:hypothetical protein
MTRKYYAIFSFVLFVALLFASNNSFSQAVSLNPNSLPIMVNSDFGVACSGGQIHDDGTFENGYGWNASAGDPSGFCAKFIPTTYPFKFTKFCIALTKNGSLSNFTFTITMWKSTNGMPGVVMDTTTVTAVGVPTWSTVTIFDFNLPSTWAQVTTPGDSVYIGIKYVVTTQAGFFIGSDETTTTTLWDAWATTAAGPWQRPAVLWTGYRAFGFRAEGESAGPLVNHTPLPNTQNIAGPYTVNCVVTPAGSAITSTKLYWSRNNPTVTDSVTMTNSSGTNWTGNIPGNNTNATYRYYIKAIDATGLVGVHPAGAPTNLNMFTASSTDTTKPVITHTAIGNTVKCAWPVTCSATATDLFGIDSVWVQWRINSGVTKRFKLLLTTGSTYAAAFNSVQADILPNDVIYYKIYAQDASAQHNRDSSAQYNFTILGGLEVVTLGNGSIAMGSASGPYNTYWYGNRTQLLYTASELNAVGGCPGLITKMGFQISVVGGQAMTGLTFRLQNTALTTISSYVTTGWTTAYTGTYTVPGTGWQDVTFTTPFNWNGTNLLVEICFGNTSYTTATTVLGTTMSGMEITEYHDLSTACAYTGFTTPGAQTARANTRFTFSLVGVNPAINNLVPDKYSLTQNYPNPFNPVTRINFAIPKQGMVNLKVYDILGREVRALVSEVKSPGYYSVDFNGADLSSGVYFYRLESNGFTDIKKMMLIK